jgi:hypothetical protein
LTNTTGNNNIALGTTAGSNLMTGDNNIDIGNAGVAAESNTIRIGDDAVHVATWIGGISNHATGPLTVKISTDGRLGIQASSARFKNEIQPVNDASEAILALRPVSFRYKKEVDSDRARQFGLIAEDVAKVNPDLVIRGRDGKPFAVRYEAVNTMLLNEFLKEHRKVDQQQKQIDALTAQLKEQAAQIQKVSAQLQISKAEPQSVFNSQ